METGELIRKGRIMLGLTKAEAARSVGVTPKTYAKYEDRYSLSEEKTFDVLRKLGMSVRIERRIEIDPGQDYLQPMVIIEKEEK